MDMMNVFIRVCVCFYDHKSFRFKLFYMHLLHRLQFTCDLNLFAFREFS